MQRNVDVVAPLLERDTPFIIIRQPSLRGRVSSRILIRRLWQYAGEIDLYYGISYGQWPRYLFTRLRGGKTVCHWAGTDVLRVLRRPLQRLWFQAVIRHCIDRHLVVSENLGEELATLGVETRLVPLVSDLLGELVSLPERFTVLAYLPSHRGVFYGAPAVYEVASRNPQWRFLIVGREPTSQGKCLSNLTELGHWIDLSKVYPQVNVLVRPTVHDGLPRMVLEALSWGRYVIFSRSFPYTETGQTVEEIEVALQKVANRRNPNREAARYVQENYTEERMVDALEEVFADLLGQPR
jgi:glycosyltransferase involved in cell wall biosynthesis